MCPAFQSRVGLQAREFSFRLLEPLGIAQQWGEAPFVCGDGLAPLLRFIENRKSNEEFEREQVPILLPTSLGASSDIFSTIFNAV